VKAIFVNIFGGIMKCDTIANGIIKATNEVNVKVPIVIRLTGTNADRAFTIIDEFAKNNSHKVKLIINRDFDTAAGLVVE
jgi:succinyl-CoA synthetase beta subunit